MNEAQNDSLSIATASGPGDALTFVTTFDPKADLTGTPATHYIAATKGGASGVRDVSGHPLAANQIATCGAGVSIDSGAQALCGGSARTWATRGLVALATIASPLATADGAGWYNGFNMGQSRTKIDDARIVSGLLGAGFTATSIAGDDRNSGFRFFGGYQFNKFFSLEGGYFGLGRYGFVLPTMPPGTQRDDIEIKVLHLDAVGVLPINERFSAFGRGGLNYVEARDSFSGTGSVDVPNPNRGKRAANYTLGLGLEYALSASIGLRAEAERYRVNDAAGNQGDIDFFSGGMVVRF